MPDSTAIEAAACSGLDVDSSEDGRRGARPLCSVEPGSIAEIAEAEAAVTADSTLSSCGRPALIQAHGETADGVGGLSSSRGAGGTCVS
mmetsp:Transcript_129723/g.225389  ORF Transcript_129723/g.225389 Transcript_129723/m.225389 type:complete len:89 (+) Transcript_129723:196-462(+)